MRNSLILVAVLEIAVNTQPSSGSADYAALPPAIGIDDHEIQQSLGVTEKVRARPGLVDLGALGAAIDIPTSASVKSPMSVTPLICPKGPSALRQSPRSPVPSPRSEYRVRSASNDSDTPAFAALTRQRSASSAHGGASSPLPGNRMQSPITAQFIRVVSSGSIDSAAGSPSGGDVSVEDVTAPTFRGFAPFSRSPRSRPAFASAFTPASGFRSDMISRVRAIVGEIDMALTPALFEAMLSFPLFGYDEAAHGPLLRAVHDCAIRASAIRAEMSLLFEQSLFAMEFSNSDRIVLFSRVAAELIADIANSKEGFSPLVLSRFAPFLHCHTFVAGKVGLRSFPSSFNHRELMSKIMNLPSVYQRGAAALASGPTLVMFDPFRAVGDKEKAEILAIMSSLDTLLEECVGVAGPLLIVHKEFLPMLTDITQFFVPLAKRADALAKIPNWIVLRKRLGSFCANRAENVLQILYMMIPSETNPDPSITKVAVDIMTLCKAFIPFEAKFYVFPSLLQSAIGTVENYEDCGVQLEVPQDDQLVPVIIDNLKTFTKLELMNDVFVDFTDSDSEGYEGLRREGIARAIAQISNPSFGLFTFTDERRAFLKPVPLSPNEDVTEKKANYRMFGRLLGLAIKNSITPGIRLAPSCLYLLTHRTNPKTSEMDSFLEAEDPAWFKSVSSLTSLSDGALEALSLTFDKLRPDGGDMPVTAANLSIYMDLTKQSKLIEGIEEPMMHLLAGLGDAMRLILIDSLTVAELRKLINGDETINVAALRDATSWRVVGRDSALSAPFPIDMEQSALDSRQAEAEKFSASSPEVHEVIRWLFQILAYDFDEPLRRLFLRFVSASAYTPIGGFQRNEERGWLHIFVDLGLDPQSLPTSHTCFGHLRLPAYSSKAELLKRLVYALQNAHSIEL